MTNFDDIDDCLPVCDPANDSPSDYDPEDEDEDFYEDEDTPHALLEDNLAAEEAAWDSQSYGSESEFDME